MRQDLKAGRLVAPFDDFYGPLIDVLDPIDQLPGISPVRPDQSQAGATRRQLRYQQTGAIAILDIGGMDPQRPDQPQGVYDDMSFAARHFLAGIVASKPPFSVVLTLWLSMMAALGVGSLSAWRRTACRKVSWI